MKYAIKTVNANMTAYNGFVWPESGRVTAPDWRGTKECGNGLHAFLWGVGDYSLRSKGADAKWLVLCIADTTPMINLGGKVKFPACEVVFCGTYVKAWSFLLGLKEYQQRFKDSGHASATGYCGHASATGNCGHASATGDSGHASATGYYGHASTTGDYGHASATGDSGHAKQAK